MRKCRSRCGILIDFILKERVMRKKKLLLAVLFAALAALSLTACKREEHVSTSDLVFGINRLSGTTLETTTRNIPELSDGGLPAYPVYEKNMPGTAEAKQAVADENAAIYAYDAMDADGNLYANGTATGKKLIRHTASVKNYGGEIDSAAPAVVRRLRLRPRRHGNVLTGLYAAPGEVVTVIMDQPTAQRRYQAQIGQATQRGGANVIPTTKAFNRMPALVKNLTLDKTVNYIGSPLGGPIYINTERGTGNKYDEFEVTIIGALEMPHYVLGTTTDEEWERLKSAPGTVFDLETERGVRLTMPAYKIRGKSAREMRAAAEFWDKAAQLGHKFGNSGVANGNNPDTCLITMLFDTYVPAGAAVAFVGADFCVLPTDWAGNAVNAEQLILSGGWGALHEMNHHHQGWGAGNNGETTNNVINSLIYMLHTNIATARTESGGLDGWNWVSDAYYSLKNALGVKAKGGKNQTLSMYTVLAHAFGSDAMIAMAAKSRHNNETEWYTAVCDVTGYDMTYYLTDFCGLAVEQAAIDAVREKNLPVFVPSACLYQSGYVYESGAVEMGKPFYIPHGKEKTLDLAQYILAPEGVTVSIREVGAPAYGELREENGVYIYKPNKKSKAADSFTVRVGLTVGAIGYETECVYKLSFVQDVTGADAAIYDSQGYVDIASARDAGVDRGKAIAEKSFGYAGFSVNSSFSHSLTVLEGKIVFPQGGAHTLFIRGDDQATLYAGTDKNGMEEKAAFKKYLAAYSREQAGTFFIVSLNERQPLYFKAYVLNTGGNGSFRIGMADTSQIEGGKPIEEGADAEDSAAAKAPIVDVPAAYVFKTDAETDTVKRADYTSERLYTAEITADAKILDPQDGIKVVKTSRLYGSMDPAAAVDGDSSTTVHTQPGVFPAEFVFDLGGVRQFNYVRFSAYAASASRGRIKDYQLYAGDSLEALTLLSEGTLPSAFTSEIAFPTRSARYIRIYATDAYPGNTGEKYVAFSDFSTGNKVDGASIAPQNGTDVLYKGKWSADTFGTSIGGLAVSSDGRAEVNFHGTDFALFTKTGRAYGKADVRLDGGEWQEIDLYSDTDQYRQVRYLAAGLTDGYHKFEIKTRKNNTVNIDFFAIKPTTPPPDTGLGLWWILIITAIVIGATGIGVGAYFASGFIVKRMKARSIKEGAQPRAEKTVKERNETAAAADKTVGKTSKTSETVTKGETKSAPSKTAPPTANSGKSASAAKTQPRTAPVKSAPKTAARPSPTTGAKTANTKTGGKSAKNRSGK